MKRNQIKEGGEGSHIERNKETKKHTKKDRYK